MKIKQRTMGVLILLIFALGITTTITLNLWATTSKKIPNKIDIGSSSDAYNPSDIRGSYTFDEISSLFDIDIQVLYSAFGLPPETDGTVMKTKDLESLYENASVEIGNGSVKVFVALYKNLPIELGDDYLLKEASALIIEENKNLTQEQKTYLDTHTIEIDTTSI